MFLLTLGGIFPFHKKAEMDGESLVEFTRYIAMIVTNGNYENPWLTMLPYSIQSALFDVGQALAGWLGYS